VCVCVCVCVCVREVSRWPGGRRSGRGRGGSRRYWTDEGRLSSTWLRRRLGGVWSRMGPRGVVGGCCRGSGWQGESGCHRSSGSGGDSSHKDCMCRKSAGNSLSRRKSVLYEYLKVPNLNACIRDLAGQPSRMRPNTYTFGTARWPW
jgi:hypothetical protein